MENNENLSRVSMYRFEQASVDQFAEYNQFISSSSSGNFRQTTYWGKIKSFSGWIPQYYLLKKDGKIIAVASLLMRRTPVIPFSLIYCCRGPVVVDWSDTETCKILFINLKKVLLDNNGFCLRLDPEPCLDVPSQEVTLFNLGLIKLKERVTTWNRNLYTVRIFLDASEDELFAQMRRTHRQNINKSIKLGVSVSTELASGDRNIFFRLMIGLEGRRNSLIHSEQYYHNVYDTIVGEGCGYFIKALYQGQVISGLIVIILGGRAWAVFMANDYEFRKLMPNKLLLWEAIKLARNSGCEFIDFGSTQGTEQFDPENDPLDMLKNAYRPRIVLFPGYYDLKGKHYSLFRFLETTVLPVALSAYYKLNRFFKKDRGRVD